MNRLILLLALCSVAHSLIIQQYVEQHVEESIDDTSTACSHEPDTDNAVTAWPGSSWYVREALYTYFTFPRKQRIQLTVFSSTSDDPLFFTHPYPHRLSCPPTKLNTKCFPIWEESSDSSAVHWEELNGPLHHSYQQREALPELRHRRRYISDDPSAPATSTGYQARSVNLKWPDRMMHAIFYLDAGCQDLDDTRAENVWHVKREGTRREQCFGLGEGQWASVEFMRQDEWEIFDRRRKGMDDGVGGWGWRGLL